MGLLGRILGRPERRAWLGDALIRDHDPDAALTLRTPQAETLAVAASCLTLYERAFESAAVEGPLAFGAQMRGMIARRLIQTGNAVAFLDRVGGISVHPAALYEVEGDTPDPAEWRYRVSRNGPTGEERTVLRPASGVLHWRVNADWLTPWQGRGAGELAASSIRLMVEQDRGLTEEAIPAAVERCHHPGDAAESEQHDQFRTGALESEEGRHHVRRRRGTADPSHLDADAAGSRPALGRRP